MSDLSREEQLRNLLQGLCFSEEDHKILQQLCEAITDFNEDTVAFDNSSFDFEKNPQLQARSDLPASFAAIAKVATSLLWDGGGPEVGFELDEDGGSSADGWLFDELEDEDEAQRIREAGGGEPQAAFVAGQNALFFDPTRRLANGEPALAFVDHGCCEWEAVSSVDGLNYPQIFLRMIADAMLDTDYIPELCF